MPILGLKYGHYLVFGDIENLERDVLIAPSLCSNILGYQLEVLALARKVLALVLESTCIEVQALFSLSSI